MKGILTVVLFCVFFAPICAFPVGVQVSSPVLFPGSEVSVEVELGSQTPGEGYLYATLTLPGGKVLYVTQRGLSSAKRFFKPLEGGKASLLEFQYPTDSWLPPGSYKVEAWVEDEEGRKMLELPSASFEVNSHLFPLTYSGFDPEVGAFRVIDSNGCTWVVFAAKGFVSGKSYELYALKLS